MNRQKLRVLLLSIVQPANFCGVSVVMYRHLIENKPFDLFTVTPDAHLDPQGPHKLVTSPLLINRLKRTRFWKCALDLENLTTRRHFYNQLVEPIEHFKPDVILTLADTYLSNAAILASDRFGIPLAGMFLDWFPVMKNHYGHAWTRPILNNSYRSLYKRCDLAFCTSDGMKKTLGYHPNSHTIYPMPRNHTSTCRLNSRSGKKFRIVYVGSVENFYGRMLCSLISELKHNDDLELIIVGPNADWPEEITKHAISNGIYLGYKPPEEAAGVLASAGALLVIMSFEREYELFMRTSFTTKFLDYVAYNKPIVLWGPEYCTPVQLVRKSGGALVVAHPTVRSVISAFKDISTNNDLVRKLLLEADFLRKTVFNPISIQKVFVDQISNLVK